MISYGTRPKGNLGIYRGVEHLDEASEGKGGVGGKHAYIETFSHESP